MLNFNRRDRAPEPTPPGKFALKPQEAGGIATASTMPPPPSMRTSTNPMPLREAVTAPAPAAREALTGHPPATAPMPATGTGIPAGAPRQAAAAVAPTPGPAPAPATGAPTPGSKLSIGVNIKLKGVEISDCDVLSIEGNVDAMVRSTIMEIAEPGTLNGTALIDVAEVHGSFTGELTARTRLIIHGTGRVSGKIRYGKLVVAEGGELSGDVQRIEDAPPRP